jgi:aryl-alcohol dehydrogenase-like predicted oxidoreductase
METIRIHGTNMVDSRICLGTWSIGGSMWGGTDEQQGIRTIHTAVDSGINLIDTAPVYGFGRSEEIVGKALSEGSRRERVLIATKVGLEWDRGQIKRNSSPERLRKEIEDSLRRLRTDRIDIYQIHWPDSRVPFEETAKTLAEFLKQGKIRAIGVSNFSPAQMDAFLEGGPIHTTQPPYNLFERAIEKDVLPYAKRAGITVLAYGALCRGLLSGKMTSRQRFEGDDLRKTEPKFREPRFSQYLTAVGALDQFAHERYGKNVLALAVRWILDHENTIALWGARKPEQLIPVADVFGWSLDDSAMAEIDRILERTITDPVGPEFMAPPE